MCQIEILSFHQHGESPSAKCLLNLIKKDRKVMKLVRAKGGGGGIGVELYTMSEGPTAFPGYVLHIKGDTNT